MPVSITKNQQPEEILRKMFQRAGLPEIVSFRELTEGFFNVAYEARDAAGGEYILKIAPPSGSVLMTHEKNIMWSEVHSMKRVREELSVPAAKILYYDPGCTVCDSEYFIMEKLPGSSFSSRMEEMLPEEKDSVYRALGRYNRELNSLRGESFGYYGQPEKRGKHWYSAFFGMVCDALGDARRLHIDLQTPEEEILRLLERDREYFEPVKEPCFVHWDFWAGNVFVENGRITGLIDFERCLWADPLMEVGFRTYGLFPPFLEGYGGKSLTKEEFRRAKWYDVYLFLIACLECDYRQYDTRDTYIWGTGMLRKWIQELKEPEAIERG